MDDNKQNEMKKHLEAIDTLMQRIKVAGDDVFIMAQCRQMLKIAYDSIEEGNSNGR